MDLSSSISLYFSLEFLPFISLLSFIFSLGRFEQKSQNAESKSGFIVGEGRIWNFICNQWLRFSLHSLTNDPRVYNQAVK